MPNCKITVNLTKDDEGYEEELLKAINNPESNCENLIKYLDINSIL